MALIDTVAEAVNRPLVQLFLAGLAALALWLFLNKRDELGRNAIRNTAATVVVVGANILVSKLVAQHGNGYLQAAYDALHIPRLDPQVWEGVPLWLGALIALVAKDFVDYWNHRLMHTRWVWATHAAHHSDSHVNAFTTFRVHMLEVMLMMASYTLVLTWLQLPQLQPILVALSVLHNMYVHLDLPITHGPFRHVLASPVFHRWHHADTPEAFGKNLANIFPVFDVIFGTWYLPGPCTAPMGARSAGVEDTDPLAILLYPLRHWARLLRARPSAPLAVDSPKMVNALPPRRV